MGVFHTVAMKIQGQVKPVELGEVAEKEIELICAKYGLEVIENNSGCCASGYMEGVD